MGYFVARLKPCPDTELSDERAFFRGNEMRRSFAALRMTVLLSSHVSEARHGAPSFFVARVGTAGPSNPVAPVAFGWDDRALFQDDKLSSPHSSRERLNGAPGLSSDPGLKATFFEPCFRGLKPPAPSVIDGAFFTPLKQRTLGWGTRAGWFCCHNVAMARIAIVGAGAIGSVLAALLQSTEQHELLLCTRRPLPHLHVDTPEGSIDIRYTNLTTPFPGGPGRLGPGGHQNVRCCWCRRMDRTSLQARCSRRGDSEWSGASRALRSLCIDGEDRAGHYRLPCRAPIT